MAQKVTASEGLVIDSAFQRARNRVHRVGVELEGGWTTLPRGCNLEHDGSVRFRDTLLVVPINHIGELPSPPMEVDKYPAWMKAYYPTAVNETCGMHVHMSFKSALTYQQLMTPKYPATILKYVQQWAVQEGLAKTHPLWSRLIGGSVYCQHVFQGDEQANTQTKGHDHHAPGHRYTVINYCWARYNTLECRLLPMMQTSEQGIRAVQEIINITNAFLTASARKEAKVIAKHIVEDSHTREERKTYV